MANIDQPRGFLPVGPKIVCHRYYKSASVQLGVGDPVVRAANSGDPLGYAAVTRATTGAAVTGVVVSVESDPDRSYPYLKSADTGYVLVADDPNQEFLVQDNGGATGIVITNLGQHIDSVAAIDCDSTTGRSKYELDTEAIATDNTWVLVRKDDRPDNEVGANCDYIVKANLHTEVNASATNVTEI